MGLFPFTLTGFFFTIFYFHFYSIFWIWNNCQKKCFVFWSLVFWSLVLGSKTQNVEEVSLDLIFYNNFWYNIKSFSKQNSKMIIHSKPDRNQSKLTVCSVYYVVHMYYVCKYSVSFQFYRKSWWIVNQWSVVGVQINVSEKTFLMTNARLLRVFVVHWGFCCTYLWIQLWGFQPGLTTFFFYLDKF